MKSKIVQALEIFADERHFRLRLFFEGILIGVFTGGVITAFRFLLGQSDRLRPQFYGFLQTHPAGFTAGYFLLLVLLGAVLYRIVQKEPMSSGSGIPQIKGILLGKMHMDWARVLLFKFVGGVLAIGAGMSLGREGPSVQLGACVGQGLSRGQKRSRAEERFLLTAGAGAGLAAAFNAPLAGVIFCLEELQKNFSPLVLMATISAAVASTAVAQFAFGGAPIFHMGELCVIPLGSMYVLLLLLGIFVGALGLGFNRMLTCSLDGFRSLRLPGWQKPVVPLLAAGVLGFVLPQILGGGNLLVDELVVRDYGMVFLLLLFVGKFFFTMLCFGSGVPGGIFLPMLVLGALGGAIFAKAALLFGLLAPDYVPTFIVFGMAAYFAGVVKSPITGSILIMEMTGSFQHMLALICVSMAAYLVNDMTGGQPVYDMLLARSLRLRAKLQKAIHRRRVVAEFTVGTGSALSGRLVREIDWPVHSLLVNVRRGEEEILPQGTLCLQEGDYLYVLMDDADISGLQKLAEEQL